MRPRKTTGQLLDVVGNVIPDAMVVAGNDENVRAVWQRTLWDYNSLISSMLVVCNSPSCIPDGWLWVEIRLLHSCGQHHFHGLSHEHPLENIERFGDLESIIKWNRVSGDYMFCNHFQYSLSGDTSYWLKQFTPESLTTWDDTKTAIPAHFFDDARSEELRNKNFTLSMTYINIHNLLGQIPSLPERLSTLWIQ